MICRLVLKNVENKGEKTPARAQILEKEMSHWSYHWSYQWSYGIQVKKERKNGKAESWAGDRPSREVMLQTLRAKLVHYNLAALTLHLL